MYIYYKRSHDHNETIIIAIDNDYQKNPNKIKIIEDCSLNELC